ncbi:hypothetical protein P4B35_19725 [Pontiellaceae bacterium B12227]|nr:hypothetical protein [Pontiellaceae bacterium B12227]
MKRRHPLILLAALALPLLAAGNPQPVLDLDFTAAEGFSDGTTLDGTQSMNTQGGWKAGDTAGTGYAFSSNAWNRARNMATFTLAVDDSVVIETILRLSDHDGIYSATDSFRIGFAENAQHAGTNTPSIGSSIEITSDGGYQFGYEDAKITVDSAQATDWVVLTQTIFREAGTDQFSGYIAASNVTAGTDLGTLSNHWNQSTDDGSWGGSMRPSFRTYANTQDTALEIDRWTVVTSTNARPVYMPPPAVVTNDVTVTVDLTRKRSIGGVQTLDREQWFGVYHETGYGTREVDGKSIDEWILEEGRMLPSRGTVDYHGYWANGSTTYYSEDPSRPGYINPAELTNHLGAVGRYVTALGIDPNHKTVFSGSGHGRYPDFMCWPTNQTHGVYTVSNHAAHGEAVVIAHANIQNAGGLMPTWYEVMNESSIQNNFGWHWDPGAWDKLAELHTGVADAMHASEFSNTVRIAGPTDAYPFRDGKDGDFSNWLGSDKIFIEKAGHKMDAYAIHTYEQMVTNSTSSFDDQFSVTEIWHQGRLASFIDLWENDHHLIHGGTLPFVFSEYGMLGNKNPYGDRNAYYQVRSCNGILLSLMDRPDVVDKMSAFLMSQAPYNWNQKRVFFASEDSGTTMYKTSYFEYLRFWHDLDGDYLFSETDNQHLTARAFLNNNDTLYVVMKNNFNAPFRMDLAALLPAGAATGAAEIQRIYFNGIDDVARDPFAPLASLNDVLIVPDETVMLRVPITGIPQLLVWEEYNHYGSGTLVPMVGSQAEAFSFDVPSDQLNGNAEGRVNISLYSKIGFSGAPPQVSVNGTVVTNVPDVSFTDGAVRSWKQITVPVPAGILKQGANSVVITPTEGGGTKKITSVRLTTVSALGDASGDGVPDWWLIENDLDPLVDRTLVDTDIDGYTDADEYICGTDPKNSNSFLRVSISPVLVSNSVSINFVSSSNRLYAVEVSDNLLSNDWNDATNGITGTDDLIQLYDPAGESNRFYRLKVEVE